MYIPNSAWLIEAIIGEITDVLPTEAWVQDGAITPEQAQQAAENAFYSLRRWDMLGAVIPMFRSTEPAGMLLCDGRAIVRTAYPDLWDALPASMKSSEAILLPDLRGRAVLGAGHGPGLSTYNLGDAGGEERHTLSVGEMPTHNHSYAAAVTTIINGGVEAPATSAYRFDFVTGNAGGGLSHENRQPYMAVNWFMVAV